MLIVNEQNGCIMLTIPRGKTLTFMSGQFMNTSHVTYAESLYVMTSIDLMQIQATVDEWYHYHLNSEYPIVTLIEDLGDLRDLLKKEYDL